MTDVTVWWTPDCGALHVVTNPNSISLMCPDVATKTELLLMTDQAKTPAPGQPEPTPPDDITEPPLESEDDPRVEHTQPEEGN